MRKRLLCPQLPKPNRSILLPEGEANHAVRVMRLRAGDQVEILDGNGNHVMGRLAFEETGVRVEYVETLTSAAADVPALVPLTLEIAVLKGEAMEWVVEKATELGIQRLQPILTDYTVVQTKEKGPQYFRDRWQKIADQTLKQCGRLERLDIQTPLKLDQALMGGSFRLWCDEASRVEGGKLLSDWVMGRPPELQSRVGAGVSLLIGPEGGWSENERRALGHSAALRMTLGPLIFRAETAAIFGMSIISAFMRSRC